MIETSACVFLEVQVRDLKRRCLCNILFFPPNIYRDIKFNIKFFPPDTISTGKKYALHIPILNIFV